MRSNLSRDGRDNGAIPLGPNRRTKLSLLADAFRMVGKTDGTDDLDVVGVSIDYLWQIFSDGAFLDRFLKAKGQL